MRSTGQGMDDMTRKQFIEAALASAADDCVIWPYAVRKKQRLSGLFRKEQVLSITMRIALFAN